MLPIRRLACAAALILASAAMLASMSRIWSSRRCLNGSSG
mgnify:CR=1 FL=1